MVKKEKQLAATSVAELVGLSMKPVDTQTKAIDKRVFMNFCDKNVIIAHFFVMYDVFNDPMS